MLIAARELHCVWRAGGRSTNEYWEAAHELMAAAECWATERLTLPRVHEARLELWGWAERYTWDKAFGLPRQADSAACLIQTATTEDVSPVLEAELIDLAERVE